MRFGRLEGESNTKAVVRAYCDRQLCQCSISAQRMFLGVNQTLSQRKIVNSSRKCFGDSFSEKTGAA